MTTPVTKPSVTSWRTNRHQTKSPPRAASAATSASTGGQRQAVVEPGLEVERVADQTRHPRVRHDARGEHRVGGRQQRADEERLRPGQVRQGGDGHRDDGRGDRHRDDERAQRHVPFAAEHLGLDLEAVAEQDHDERDDRQHRHEPACRVELEHAEPAGAEREAGEDEQRRQRQEAASRDPRDERAADEQRPEHRECRLRRRHRGTVSDVRAGDARGADHGPRQVAGVAGRRRRLQWLPGRGGRRMPAPRLRQRRVLQAAPLPRLHRHRRGRHLAPARRPLPRPRPVRLRADVRAAPAAGAGRPLAGHGPPGAPAPVRAARRARDVPPHRRGVGQRGPHREGLRADRVRPGRTLDVGPLRISFHEVPHFTTTFAVSISSTNGGGRFTYGADSAPNDELVAFADGADLLLIEATLPRPEREGRAGTSRRPRPARTARAPASARLVITHISDELDELWAREEAEQAFGGPVLVAHEGAVYTV